MSDNPTQHFKSLGAPLKNSRWSWGAERSDGTVFLRVWRDQRRQDGSKWYIRLTDHAAFMDQSDNLGYAERVRHVSKLREGSPGYLVMCTCDDPRGAPRKLKSFDKRDLFPVGAIKEFEGDTWCELLPRVVAKSV